MFYGNRLARYIGKGAARRSRKGDPMQKLMFLIWMAACALAGASVAVLAGLAVMYCWGADLNSFNVPVICVLVAVALSPLILAAMWPHALR